MTFPFHGILTRFSKGNRCPTTPTVLSQEFHSTNTSHSWQSHTRSPVHKVIKLMSVPDIPIIWVLTRFNNLTIRFQQHSVCKPLLSIISNVIRDSPWHQQPFNCCHIYPTRKYHNTLRPMSYVNHFICPVYTSKLAFKIATSSFFRLPDDHCRYYTTSLFQLRNRT